MFEVSGVAADAAAWVGEGFGKFIQDFPETAINAVIFGFAIGGTINWFRRRAFRAHRGAISTQIADIHRKLMTGSRNIFEAIRIRDADLYRKIKNVAAEIPRDLNEFLTDYATDLSPIQSVFLKHYKRAAEDIAKRLDFGNVTKSFAPDGRTFDLDKLDELFGGDSFGPLLAPGASAFVTADALLSTFIGALGIWWRRKSFLSTEQAVEAEVALKELKSAIADAKAAIAHRPVAVGYSNDTKAA